MTFTIMLWTVLQSDYHPAVLQHCWQPKPRHNWK